MTDNTQPVNIQNPDGTIEQISPETNVSSIKNSNDVSLQELLDQKQKKLIAGDNITIDTNGKISAVAGEGGKGGYVKPDNGIPKSDLAEDVQSSLDKADTAVQPEEGKDLFSGNYDDLTNKPTIPAEMTVDSALSDTSENPVQNKVVKAELDKKATADSLTQLAAKMSNLHDVLKDVLNKATFTDAITTELYDNTPSTTYTVAYNLNGHGDAISSVSGVTAIPSTLPTPSASGYTFGGWYTDSGLTTTAVAGATITQNTTLYAKWTEITLVSIAIKTAPTKTSYTEEDTFDASGLVITKTLSDGTTSDVAYSSNPSSFSFSPTTLATTDTSVTITYGGKITTQIVSVEAALGLVNISFDTDALTAELSASNSTKILYSLDGSTPATEYTTAITMANGNTLTAVATNGTTTTDLPIVTATYDADTQTIALSTTSGTITYSKDGGSTTEYSSALDASSVVTYIIYVGGIETTTITIIA